MPIQSHADAEVGRIQEHIRHEKYDSNNPTGPHDIALLHLRHPAQHTRPAKLISPDQERLVYPGAVFTVAGWGATTEGGESVDLLNAVELPIVSNTKCGDEAHYGLLNRIHATQLCAGKEDGKQVI